MTPIEKLRKDLSSKAAYLEYLSSDFYKEDRLLQEIDLFVDFLVDRIDDYKKEVSKHGVLPA